MNNLFPIPPEELAAIDNAAAAFREQWLRIKSPPWAAPFNFTHIDVKSLDYMEYEGLKFPDCGTDGAVLIVAEVVRRAAQIQWYLSFRGEWILANDDRFPDVAIAPRARFHEYQCGRRTQFNNYSNLMAELALECLSAEHGEGLFSLFEAEDQYISRVQEKLAYIRNRNHK